MCGRTACTLDPRSICLACSYKNAQGVVQQPEWRDAPNGQYYPSQNIAPSKFTPILVAKNVLENSELKSDERVIIPMRWGLVPRWYKGELKEFKVTNNNARSETVMEKRTFNVPLKKGLRCVILAEGYYEWRTFSPKKKQPYLIYFPQPEGIKIEDYSKMENADDYKGKSWYGPKILTMAGIFEPWKSPDNELVYTYSILTMEASPAMSWIHERMPAILDGEKAIEEWLASDQVPLSEAMKLIVPVENLVSHPVSSDVNNARNHSQDCMKPVDLESPMKPKPGNLMNWLTTGKLKTKVKKDEDEQLQHPVKREALDDYTSPSKIIKKE